MPEITPSDFFINDVAKEAGLTGQLWHLVYSLYMRELQSDSSFDAHDVERTFRVPSRQGHIDVLVRCQPEPREFRILRFTAFPAGAGKVLQISRVYELDESRPVLGEAALLDVGSQW